jgi:hypothetical protein
LVKYYNLGLYLNLADKKEKMSYIINWEEKGVYCKFSKIVSGKELTNCNMAIYGDPRFDNIRYQIFDMVDVTEFKIDVIDVRIVASCDHAAAKTNPRVKCALVATDKIALALSRVYQDEISESPWEGRSFTNIKNAREWLIQTGTT